MIPSGLTSLVINRASLGDGYVRVRDSGLVTAVAQFLYDEAALLDEWRLDEWLALFHPVAANYLIPSPEDLSDDPACKPCAKADEEITRGDDEFDDLSQDGRYEYRFDLEDDVLASYPHLKMQDVAEMDVKVLEQMK